MFSVVILCNKTPGDNRFELLDKTLEAYYILHPDMYNKYPGLEFILVTASKEQLTHRADRIVRYNYPNKEGFNPSLALNIGVSEARNTKVIITCPEVKPTTPVLYQFSEEECRTVQAQVFEDGKPLSNSSYRNTFPGFYFLTMYNREDILALNGWDEDFLQGYGWEDTDFGERFKRAGFQFKIRDDIQAIHQNHPRNSNYEKYLLNKSLFDRNNSLGIIRPKNGLIKLVTD